MTEPLLSEKSGAGNTVVTDPNPSGSEPVTDNITNKSQPQRQNDTVSHVHGHNESVDYQYKEPSIFRKFFYDFILWFLWNCFQCFFREIKSHGGFKVPKNGPVIFVAAPHANQFVDPIILMQQVKEAVNRRVSFLIAEASLKQPAIGFFARCTMTIGVVRPQDNLRIVENGGRITLDPNDYTHIIGHGTHFLRDCGARGLLGLPKNGGFVEIQSIESDTSLYLRKEFKMNKPEVRKMLLDNERGTVFKFAPKVDQSLVYHKVFEHLANGNCIGIFPEGGSHDRTDLLPLRAGVAIMALGCMDKHPDVNVKIVPCGMNYFHAHKFRSRAVVEFNDPIEIPRELVEKYGNPNTNKEAVKTLLEMITQGLKDVTVTCEDYETLMLIQAMRRLYSARMFKNDDLHREQPSLPAVIDMNRKLVRIYEMYKGDPKFVDLKRDIVKYNEHLKYYNIPDHVVETARVNLWRNLGLLLYRSVFITVALLLALPGTIMFAPVFYLAKRISREKARKALANSTVKIKANDVIATWKILISILFAPIFYILWSSIITLYLTRRYDMSGHSVILGNKILIFLFSYISCVCVTYSALVVGDRGMDTLKSLKPLYLSVVSPNGMKDLQRERAELTNRIVDTVNTFAGKSYFEFDKAEEKEKEEEATSESELRRRKPTGKTGKGIGIEHDISTNDSSYAYGIGETTSGDISETESVGLSLVNSTNSLSNIPLFGNSYNYSSYSQSELSLSTYSTNDRDELKDEWDRIEPPEDDNLKFAEGREEEVNRIDPVSSKIMKAMMDRRKNEEEEEEEEEEGEEDEDEN